MTDRYQDSLDDTDAQTVKDSLLTTSSNDRTTMREDTKIEHTRRSGHYLVEWEHVSDRRARWQYDLFVRRRCHF